MANTFTCLEYHVVFSTKHREPWLRPEVEQRVWAYLANGTQNLRCSGIVLRFGPQ